ncbi:MAG: YCF48-related protein [Cyclobacteriaceae bacterium]
MDPWNGQTTSGLYYAEIDLSLNNGNGDVISKGTRLVANTTNNLGAIMHANGKDFWVITHTNNTNTYSVISITDQGISSTIQHYSLGASHAFWDGQLKFSPDGKKVATCYSDFQGGWSLFDFDKSTGVLSNAMDFSFLDIDNSPILEGMDFSSDATKLYVGEVRYGWVFQYDVTLSSQALVNNSRKQTSGVDIFNEIRQFQLAPDGNIYITKGGGGGGTGYLGVISNLNGLAQNAVLKENSFYLQGQSSFVDFTPNFVQDYLYKTSFSYDGNCQGQPINFKVTNQYHVDSVRWYFGEGTYSTNINPSFTYTVANSYFVQLLAYHAGVADTVTQQVVINPYTSFSLGADVSICRNSIISAPDTYNHYHWNNGDTISYTRPQQSGTYSLTAINNFGCPFSDTLNVAVIDLPVISIPDSVKLNNGSATLNAVVSPNYLWNTGATTSSITVNTTAWYSVEVTNAFGCKSSKSFFVYANLQPDFTPPSQWVRISPSPSGSPGADIHFLDDQNGFIVNGAQLLHTTNGGDVWSIQTKMSGATRIGFKNSIGYVSCVDGKVYKSTQYGGGWNQVTSVQSYYSPNAISVVHQDSVFITDRYYIYSTGDGGKTWTNAQTPNQTVSYSCFTSSKVGHLVCYDGSIYKTSDGGKTWKLTAATGDGFTKIKFINSLTGFALTGSTIFYTVNGGEFWNQDNYSPYSGNDFWFFDTQNGYMAGEYGSIVKTTDGTVNWQWAGFDGLRDGNDLYGICFVNKNVGFAIGLGGRIIRTLDGAKTWQNYVATQNPIQQITFASPQVAYFISYDEMFKTLDGGYNWKSIRLSHRSAEN